jgi:signal transduction histidine kinase
MAESRSERSWLTRFVIGVLAALVVSVVLIMALMRPPLRDLAQLTLSSGITALASILIGVLAYRLGFWRRIGSLSMTLTLGYVLAAGLTLLNVWINARLMFASLHDLALAGVLLVFASGISVSFGYLVSSSLTRLVRQMVDGARRLSRGDFSARVQPEGRDEVAELAQAFNDMASQLELAGEEKARMEGARREFVAWVSHDLRTPLSALRAMIDAMADGVVKDDETVERYLRQCQTELDRMRDLIDDLFQLAQLDAGHMEMTFEACSLADLISDTLGSAVPKAAAKHVKVSGWVDPAVDPVRLAPREIGRVLRNLLDNALRHTPEGGEIQLTAGLENGSVVVSVSDTGEGISEEDLPRVFERFYRGEASRSRDGFESGGAGLGLAIARGFVEAHGGRIWAESPPGEGTRVSFSLPSAKVG